MKNSFIADSRELLNRLPSLTGDSARVAHRLSQAIDLLDALVTELELQHDNLASDLTASPSNEIADMIEARMQSINATIAKVSK